MNQVRHFVRKLSQSGTKPPKPQAKPAPKPTISKPSPRPAPSLELDSPKGSPPGKVAEKVPEAKAKPTGPTYRPLPKYEGGWQPKKKLPRESMDHLRNLRAMNPELYSVSTLSSLFGIRFVQYYARTQFAAKKLACGFFEASINRVTNIRLGESINFSKVSLICYQKSIASVAHFVSPPLLFIFSCPIIPPSFLCSAVNQHIVMEHDLVIQRCSWILANNIYSGREQAWNNTHGLRDRRVM
jgi:hypothetical protein